MATKYLDHGLYPSIASVPTWGVAQDGDGTAVGASTPAIVSIDLSAATAAAGATFVVMGAVLTCVTSGAGANQFNAGSGATLVANLVSAINSASATNVCSAAPHNTARWKTPKIQDTVFARIGTPTTTLQIMTRAGSSSYNGVGTIATSGFTGGTFGPYSFSGGAGGAWGWVLNTVAALGSAQAICTYGAWAQNGVLAGAFDGGDLVYVRSGKTITIPANNYNCIFPTNMGEEFNPVKFRIDRSEQWSDGTNPVFTIQQTLNSNGNTFNFGAIYNTSWAIIEGNRISEGEYNFLITGRSSYQVNGGGAKFYINGPMTITGCKAENTNTGPIGFMTSGYASDNNEATIFNDVYFKWNNTSTLLGTGNGKHSHAILNGCTFDNAGNSNPNVQIIALEQYADCLYTFNGCRWINFVSGSQMFTQPTQSYGQRHKIIFSDCEFGDVSVRGPLFALQTSSYFHQEDKFIAVSSRIGKKEFSLDSCVGMYEWNTSKGQPVLNALLEDGTGWSIRVVPSTVASRSGVSRPFLLPNMGKRNTLGPTKLRLKLEFLAEKSIVLTPAKLSIMCYYREASGGVNTMDSLVQQIAPQASTAAWSQLAVDPADSQQRVTFQNPGTIYFNRYTLTLDTPTIAAADTDVTMIPMVRFLADDVTKNFFIDPEITLTAIP